MRLDNTLIWIHAVGVVFWIGAITSVGLLLLSDGDDKARGKLAHFLYLRLAVPGFVVAFLAGSGRLLLDGPLYMKQPWMHIKLTVALVVIVTHHLIGARARKLAGGLEAGRPTALVAALVLSAVLAVFLVVVRLPAG